MTLFRGILFVIATLIIPLADQHVVSAEVSTTTPDAYYSPVYITSFGTNSSDGAVQDVGLQFFQLKNNGSSHINLTNWSVSAYASNSLVCKAELNSWILAGESVISAQESVIDSRTNKNVDNELINCMQNINNVDLILLKSSDAFGQESVHDAIAIPPEKSGAYERRSGALSARTGDFAVDFKELKSTLVAGEWYRPLEDTPIKIVEVMPHSRECSPLENTLGCQDYVKLYNPLNEVWPLEKLRLRIGYAGQNVTSSNAIVLGGSLPAGGYGVISTKTNGDALSITNSGGWIWLEDMHGIGDALSGTVINYPSASSSSKTGWSWAYDSATNDWQWTSKLSSGNLAPVFEMPSQDQAMDSVSELKPCRPDQYRNPLTNRCKLKDSSTSKLVDCAPNQFRNPLTNRCKLTSSGGVSGSSLKPCKAGQFRNPETNRCKSLTSSDSGLKPCQIGWERNPETNRCRKVANASFASASHPVQPYGDSSKQYGEWLIFSVVASLAVGYGIWEWRSEIGESIGKLKQFIRR
ncbi:hypothetical protein H6796_02915 [Candidatus Nomurabacteria bacterium]|nr:hypothetical protein [Candidatus Nomurabacteria bacterium]